MNFTLPDELLALQAKTRDFIAEQVIPLENDPARTATAPATPCARTWWPAPAPPAC